MMTSSTHSFAYFISTGQEIFCENLRNFKSVITSLFFNRFSSGFHTLCLKFFTLSSEIKLNLLWSSSLISLPKKLGKENRVPVMYLVSESHHVILTELM